MKFSEDQTYKFVKIYLKHAHLWKSKHKAKNLRMKLCRDILTEFEEATGIELNVVEVKKKIKTLRSTYTQELSKIKLRSTPDCPHRSVLKWFSLWHEYFDNANKDEVESCDEATGDSSEIWVSETNNLDTNIDQEDDISIPTDESINSHRRTKSKWSQDQTYKFVKIYLKHEHLWNSQHEHYKAMHFRMKSYREIVTEFREATGIGMDVEEVKIKIKILGSTYTQELTKIKYRSRPDHEHKSNLKWFGLWHKCFSNIKREIVAYDHEDTQKSSEGWLSETNHLDPNIDPFQDNDYCIMLKIEPDSFEEDTTSNTTHRKVKKKKVKLTTPSVDSSDRTFRGSMDSTDLTKEDEFDIYGKYIATQLRKMDLQKALKVQLEIQTLVSEARITELKS